MVNLGPRTGPSGNLPALPKAPVATVEMERHLRKLDNKSIRNMQQYLSTHQTQPLHVEGREDFKCKKRLALEPIQQPRTEPPQWHGKRRVKETTDGALSGCFIITTAQLDPAPPALSARGQAPARVDNDIFAAYHQPECTAPKTTRGVSHRWTAASWGHGV